MGRSKHTREIQTHWGDHNLLGRRFEYARRNHNMLRRFILWGGENMLRMSINES